MDPEDVEALLRPNHERVRSELERHGGSVEKFIGDAVMALFGAPTAHEDDPERAVRAALAIREFAMEEQLELRVGITTGKALVRLDAQPEAGEGMASGDVVNTAARLQGAAPVNGILVDETTYRATRQAIDFREADAVEAKGKAEPIAVWEALTAHARFGVDVAHEARTELVGRERELSVLRDAFERARHERIPQLVTLVGVPGIGKSRLVYELSRIADADAELITWRQGRCLAYGDGVTLWALGEIVKAQAGVLEQDSPSDVQAKIRRAVEDALVGSGDEAWVESHLLALVGLAGEAELGGDRRNEAFAGWRRFLEAMAEQRPSVLVFEDLHWADESLLDFVDELVDWVTDAPLLVVGTARPELLERRPGWGGGKLNTTTLALAPLSQEQTATLIGQLLERPVLEAEAQLALIERAGGNPLYAEQFADLFVERGSTDELPLPETLQGIIAARLDGLPAGEKGLLQDAAVVGKVFWASALRGDAGDVVGVLHTLERKGFVRRQKRSSLEGESEFAFAHALVRDVAYEQIPRADRAAKHRRVAEWIESLGRLEDHAEMRAHHWGSALELARASGTDEDDVVEPARVALRDAGDRAAGLNNHEAAASLYEDALELWPEGDAERADLLFRRGQSLYLADDDRAASALEAARDALLQTNATDLAAEAESYLALVAWYRGHGEEARSHLERAEELVGSAVSASAARVLAVSARTRAIALETEKALRLAQNAYDMADALGLDELRAHALTTLALAHRALDDPAGDAEIERALEIALEIDSPIASSILNNMAVEMSQRGDLVRTKELYERALSLAERYGERGQIRFIRGNLMFVDFSSGRWDSALVTAGGFIAETEAGAPHAQSHVAYAMRGSIHVGRDDLDGALDDHLRALDLARERQDPQSIVITLTLAAATYAERGELDDARRLVDELLPLLRKHPILGQTFLLAPWAGELGVRDELLAICDTARRTPQHEASRHAVAGDFRGAADIYGHTGHVTAEAHQRHHAGWRALELGDLADAEDQLRRSLEFHRSVDATYYIRRTEELLAELQRDSA
jgi:tetratricopeptide (TPR) repeat protein